MEYVSCDNLTAQHLNICLMGAPGMGKTHLLGTVAEVCKFVVLDVDNGALTFKQLPNWEKIKHNIYILKMTEFADLDVFYKHCVINKPAAWNKLFNPGIKDPKDYKVVVDEPFEFCAIDSGSSLQKMMVEAIRKGNGIEALSNITKLQPLQLQDWAKVIDLFRLATQAFCNLPMSFLITAHEQLIKDELSGQVFGAPMFNGKVANDYGKYFDIYSRLSVSQKGEYVMANVPVGPWASKTRINADSIIVDPTYKKLIKNK